MRRRRLVWLAVASLAALAVPFAPSARAEGDEPEIYYDWSTMKLAADAMPEGWKLIQGASEAGGEQRQAIHDAIAESTKEANADAQAADAYLQSIDLGGGKVATVVLVDVRSKPQAILAALKARAEKAGWAFREMGSPARLMVAAAPDDMKEKVVAVQTKWAGRQLSLKASSELEKRYFPQAESLAKAAVAVEPGAALAHLTLAFLAEGAMRRDAKPEEWDKVVQEYRSALDEKAAIPLSDRESGTAWGGMGGALLQKKDAASDAAGRDALKKAVERAASLDPQVATEYRYNLACAHGRLKEVDAAFEQLSATLAENEKHPDGRLDFRNDSDFDNIHADPRWEELKKKYPAHGAGGGN